MKRIFRLLAAAAVAAALFTGPSALANGGDQRIAEGKYLVNLSRTPFTPRAGEKMIFLISFGDVAKDALIAEELIVRIRIAQLADASGRQKFLYEQGDLRVAGGVLEFAYTFAEPGLHEIFVDFAFASAPKKTYSPPDFLLDVQPPVALQAEPVPACPLCAWMMSGWAGKAAMVLMLTIIPALLIAVLVLAIIVLLKKAGK